MTAKIDLSLNRGPLPHGAVTTNLEHMPHALENQLELIISSAREIAVAAEETLRELVRLDGAEPVNSTALKALAIAPRLLVSTQQQLDTVLRMLRDV